MSRTAQRARIMERADRDARFKWRDIEAESIDAWRAVDRMTTAEPHELATVQVALLEMRDKINAMLGDVK